METGVIALSLLTAFANQYVDQDTELVTACSVVGALGLMMSGQLDLSLKQTTSKTSAWNNYLRSSQSEGVSSALCCLLVPVAVMLSSVTKLREEGASDYANFQLSLAVAQCIAGIIICQILLTNMRLSKDPPELASSASMYSLPLGILFVICSAQYYSLGVVSSLVQVLAVFIQCVSQPRLPLWCPMSFTLGEAAIISQSMAYFLGNVICNVLQKFGYLFESSYSEGALGQTTFYMEMAVLCCFFVAVILFSFACLQNILGFYVVFATVMSMFAFPSLYVLLGQNFVKWTWQYVTESPDKIYLFAYWAVCSGIAAFVVTVNSCAGYLLSTSSTEAATSSSSQDSATNIQPLAHNDLQTAPHSTDKAVRGSCTRFRKLFHILAVAIFVPGAMWEPVMMCMAGTCGLVVFIMMEIMRLLSVPPLGAMLQATFPLLLDEQDQGPVILTHMYLLVGCLCPLWLYPLQAAPSHVAMYSGVIALGVGDTAAAVVGSAIGTHRWKGTRRTMEGTLAAVLSQILFIWFLQYLGAFVAVISWSKVLVAVILTSLAEAYTTHVDNLILPLIMYSLLL